MGRAYIEDPLLIQALLTYLGTFDQLGSLSRSREKSIISHLAVKQTPCMYMWMKQYMKRRIYKGRGGGLRNCSRSMALTCQQSPCINSNININIEIKMAQRSIIGKLAPALELPSIPDGKMYKLPIGQKVSHHYGMNVNRSRADASQLPYSSYGPWSEDFA